MTTHLALTTIDEAIERTRQLLWPPKKGIWIRIALIALFLGGGLISPPNLDTISPSSSGVLTLSPDSLSDQMELMLTVASGIVVAGLLYVMVSAIFQFVFVDCLSSGKVSLAGPFRLRWRKGMHLVGFYLVLLLIMFICMVFLTFWFLGPVLSSGNPDILSLLIAVVQMLILLFIILIPVWILAILTADFVVPVMITDDTGIITGWSRVITLFSGRWIEAGIYTGLKIMLIVISGMIIGVAAFLISLPFSFGLFSGGIGYEVSGSGSSELLSLLAGTLLIFLVSLFLLVPVLTFFRYYSLAVLRTLDSRYDLLSQHLE